MVDNSKRKIRISVRSFVEFLLRSGDIDSRKRVRSEDAMQEGSRIHRMLQRQMGSEYEAEVTLKYVEQTPEYELVIHGRADGVITEQKSSLTESMTTIVNPPSDPAEGIRESQITIDEIKSTHLELHRMKRPEPVHLAQAKCYAYMYALQKDLSSICVRMTYCNIDNYERRYFIEEYEFEELESWFLGLVEEYKKWADYEVQWRKLRQASIKETRFPYPYRQGQKELASAVYRTIYHQKKLFLEAPTGVGKTLSTVFPSVKALGEERGERLFYFTAKTITRTAAEQAFTILRNEGLKFKTVILTAKEKICFADEVKCNPDACPYANGHFDRINDTLYDLITHEEAFTREIIEEYARKHRVCPFELGLDASLFADGIIGDYNYLFDPHVYLKRFFEDSTDSQGIFLIDEAHNLVERGREMYSAVLVKEDFLALKKTVKPYSPKLGKRLEKCNHELLQLKKQTEGVRKWDSIGSFILALNRLSEALADYLENHDDSPVRDEVLDFYFEVSHFLLIYDFISDDYVMYSKIDDKGNFFLKLFCVNPAKRLKECMAKGVSSILFSATLLPIQYYKKLLGGTAEDYEVYAESTFDSRKRGLFIASDVTSRYTRRTDEEFYRIASYIHNIVSERQGNYLVFFPSYVMLTRIHEIYEKYFNADKTVECLLQKEYMKEEEREDFLKQFTGEIHLKNREEIQQVLGIPVEFEERTLLGFCVMGGIFSEGIDLKEDSLIGAIVVGTGLPLVCTEREILKEYFDDENGSGFDYAYRYPGMNKVLQAAGRVIRTTEDVGIVALLDERFLGSSYTRLFPREWTDYKTVQGTTIGKQVEKFWNEWL